jgi:hypothetical protein
MKASSESGLCATEMVSEELTPGFYVSEAPLDLTCVSRNATMNSTVKARDFRLYLDEGNF